MKKITVGNYREDKYYPKVVRAVEAILANGDVVAPIDAFVHMGLLSKADVELWRFGRVPYLEKVIHCRFALPPATCLSPFGAHEEERRPAVQGSEGRPRRGDDPARARAFPGVRPRFSRFG